MEEHQNAAFFGGEMQLGFPGHFLNDNHSPNVSAKVYAPLKFARTLYVFACRKQDCNSVKAFSMVNTKYEEPSSVKYEELSPAEPSNKPTVDWGTEEAALPKSGTPLAKTPTNDDDDLEALLQARAAKTNQKAATNTQQKSGKGKGKGKAASVVVHTKETPDLKAAVVEQPKPVAVAEEKVKKEDCLPPWEVVWDDAKNCGQTIDLSKEEKLLRLYRATEGQLEVPEEGEENETFAEEAYEAEEGDRSWRKFTKAIAQCPKQCARYCFGGLPLRMSDEHCLPSPQELACPHCHRPRVFELQLLPTLCSELEEELEWGTVDVYVCPASCQPDLLVQEFAILHPAI